MQIGNILSTTCFMVLASQCALQDRTDLVPPSWLGMFHHHSPRQEDRHVVPHLTRQSTPLDNCPFDCMPVQWLPWLCCKFQICRAAKYMKGPSLSVFLWTALCPESGCHSNSLPCSLLKAFRAALIFLGEMQFFLLLLPTSPGEVLLSPSENRYPPRNAPPHFSQPNLGYWSL